MSTRPAARSLLLVEITVVIAVITFILMQAPQASDVGMLVIYSGFGMLVEFLILRDRSTRGPLVAL
ncbi:hypothetical protein EV140_2192 [Microcella alkaliphila]|uniref:Uncharacterized protein n=1 Tax=Microcella alkaliphila TaxID=279828 RepID=A0A4Q7TE71_9MICO|nr:hypothetical protein [Microcella alkaliphila]RZT58423.1 hypothetical protein EV140_2192 [Microcella alkaliphila]